MSLKLIDRLKALLRFIKIIVDPKTEYVNLMWTVKTKTVGDSKNNILTHTFYQDGTDPIDPFLVYMARVAGNSNNVEQLNKRAEFYLDKVAVAYMLFNPSEENQIVYIAKPLREIKKLPQDEDDS